MKQEGISFKQEGVSFRTEFEFYISDLHLKFSQSKHLLSCLVMVKFLPINQQI